MTPRIDIRTPMGRVVLVYGGVSLVLWTIPLVNRLHAESAAVVAGVGFFAAGLASLALFRQEKAFGTVLARQLAALTVPWLLLTLAALWAPNCGYGQGMLFFLLFAPPSVVLAVALAYALSATRWRRKKSLFVAFGLAVALCGPIYDLGFHPQFYVYNHVFGGVLGPIYDEDLVIRPGLVVFRGLTLLWAVLAYLAGQRLRHRAEVPGARVSVRSRAFWLAVVLAIGGCYLFAVPLGINTAGWHIQQTLGGVHRTEHFDIYYDPAELDAGAVRRLADDHEFRYAQHAARLETTVTGRIASYLYPDAETKARLTGARNTNVAPVWLRRPQTHVLLPVYEQVFAHELAHVFSREFGLPWIKASLSVGLVEGLAVALEPPDGLPTPHEQVSAAFAQRQAPGAASGLADDLATRLSPLGFWTGRGAVSYTTMGSFVRYLLDAYGAARLKRVYAWAHFEAAYGKPLAELAAEWQRYVLDLPMLDRDAGPLVARRFSRPSLFEQRCPHYVPVYRRRYQRGVAAPGVQLVAEAPE